MFVETLHVPDEDFGHSTSVILSDLYFREAVPSQLRLGIEVESQMNWNYRYTRHQ